MYDHIQSSPGGKSGHRAGAGRCDVARKTVQRVRACTSQNAPDVPLPQTCSFRA